MSLTETLDDRDGLTYVFRRMADEAGQIVVRQGGDPSFAKLYAIHLRRVASS
jgi:hypothetical protein